MNFYYILVQSDPANGNPGHGKNPAYGKIFLITDFYLIKLPRIWKFLRKWEPRIWKLFWQKLTKKWEKMAFLGEILTIFVLAKMYFSM